MFLTELCLEMIRSTIQATMFKKGHLFSKWTHLSANNFFTIFWKPFFDKIESAHLFIKIILQMKALESFLIFCDTFYFKILGKKNGTHLEKLGRYIIFTDITTLRFEI